MFQSTRPRGARLQQLALDEIALKGFNPRAHVGRDSAAALGSPSRPVFQSTRPRGARQSGDIFLFSITRFNPRAHVGRDQVPKRPQGTWHVSIHAPTWGATNFTSLKFSIVLVSIHAPTWGATNYDKYKNSKKRFQSTRPRGARLSQLARVDQQGSFNPRAHVGRDRTPSWNTLLQRCFNPRAHVGRDASSSKT